MAPFNSLKGAFALKRSSVLWNSVAQKEGQNFSDLALLSEVNRSSSRKNTKGRKCLRNELFNEAKQFGEFIRLTHAGDIALLYLAKR